jgi:hypothetical protein
MLGFNIGDFHVSMNFNKTHFVLKYPPIVSMLFTREFWHNVMRFFADPLGLDFCPLSCSTCPVNLHAQGFLLVVLYAWLWVPLVVEARGKYKIFYILILILILSRYFHN